MKRFIRTEKDSISLNTKRGNSNRTIKKVDYRKYEKGTADWLRSVIGGGE